jgi:hypothetical protein
VGLRAKVGRTLAPIDCKRRDCPVCGPRKDRELARVLVLDAREDAPTHALTLTTHERWEQLDPATFRNGMARVVARLRRRLGRCDYFGMVEFTTGRAATSGGHRRMHSHNLLKFGGAIDVLEVEQLVRDTWRASTGAYVVEVAELLSPGAALGYLALHHRKVEQAAPRGWSGMVERHSLGYFVRPIAQLRDQARHELRVEAIAHVRGISLELAELEVAASPEPVAWKVREPINGGAVIVPVGEL